MHFLSLFLVLEQYLILVYHRVAILHILSRSWEFLLYRWWCTFVAIMLLVLNLYYLVIIPRGRFIDSRRVSAWQAPGPGGAILDTKVTAFFEPSFGEALQWMAERMAVVLFCAGDFISLRLYEPGPSLLEDCCQLMSSGLVHLERNTELSFYTFLRIGQAVYQNLTIYYLSSKSYGLFFLPAFCYLRAISSKNVRGDLLLKTARLEFLFLWTYSWYCPGPREFLNLMVSLNRYLLGQFE